MTDGEPRPEVLAGTRRQPGQCSSNLEMLKRRIWAHDEAATHDGARLGLIPQATTRRTMRELVLGGLVLPLAQPKGCSWNSAHAVEPGDAS